jgi:hypothetical protein
MLQSGFFDGSLTMPETPFMVSYPSYIYVCTTIDLTTTTAVERAVTLPDRERFTKSNARPPFRPPCDDHPAGGVIAHFINNLSYLNYLPAKDPKVPEIRDSIATDAISIARLNLALAPSDLRSLVQISRKPPFNAPHIRSAVITIADNSQSCFSSHALAKIMQEMAACNFSEKEIDFSLQRYIKIKWLDLNIHDLIHLARAARVSKLKWPSIYGRMAELIKEGQFIQVETLVEAVRQAALTKLFQDSVLHFFNLCQPIFASRMNELKVSAIAEIFRGYGAIHRVSSMTPEMLELIENSVDHLNFKDIKRTLSGMAELGIGEDRIISKLRTRLLELCELKKIEERDLISIIWSLAVAGNGRNMEAIWPQLSNYPARRLRPEVLRLIYQTALISGLELPENLKQLTARAETRKWSRESNLPNSFELSVAKEIRRHGVRFKFAHNECGVEMDMMIRKDGLPPIAVFCDGVRYHHINQHHRYGLCGPDKMASRLLLSNGFKVVRIPDTLWRKGRYESGWLHWYFQENGGVNLADYRE